METPTEKSKTAKDQGGCSFWLIRLGIGLGIVLLTDYLLGFIFNATYPHDSATTVLIPFQNHYLASTDAYITSEGMISEFTDDPGATARFIGLCIIPFVGAFLLSVVLYLIPFTREVVLPYLPHAFIFSLLMLMVYSLFYPPVMTVFDRGRKVMIIHRPAWMFFGTKTEIPFDQISSISYEYLDTDGNDHYEAVQYANLFANTASGKIFIGDNQVGAHAESNEKVPILRVRKRETEAAVEALQLIIGK
jgi:hypothetical protein